MNISLSDFRYIAITVRAIAYSEEAQAISPVPWRRDGISAFRADLEQARKMCPAEFFNRAVAYGQRPPR